VLYGISAGDGEIVSVALSQVGNVGDYDILIKLILFITAMILLISVIGAFVCSHYFATLLQYICGVAKRMTKHDMTWKCDVKRKDEIGVLMSSLNEMSERLSVALDSLQTANERLQQDIEKEREQEKQRIDFFTSLKHVLKTTTEMEILVKDILSAARMGGISQGLFSATTVFLTK